jgi:PTH1 family peptidyl-tRNA hydrolase
MKYLLVGLGNPGTKYQNTRHNVGFLALNFINENSYNELQFKNENKFNAEILKISNELIFAKPQTFMNDSGKSIIALNNFYKIEQVIIIHDDLDIEFGRIKLSKGGSEAGHNGLKSITSTIGNDYIKVRVGISRPKYNAIDYVLSNFTKAQLTELNKNILPAVNSIVNDIFEIGFTKAQNKWN